MTTEGAYPQIFVYDNAKATIESDDVVVMRFHGIVDAPAAVKLLEFHAQWAGTKPHIFILADLTRLDRFTMAARREFHVGRSKACAMTGICIGTSFHLRVVIEMILRAARMLGHFPADVRLHFVDSEAEARGLVDRVRASRA